MKHLPQVIAMAVIAITAPLIQSQTYTNLALTQCPAAGFGPGVTHGYTPTSYDTARATYTGLDNSGNVVAPASATFYVANIINQLKHPTAALFPNTPGSLAGGYPPNDLVTVIAHRGYWEYCPESTIEALHAAMDIGVEGVEMDARLSADGALYLGHDFDLRGVAPVAAVGAQANANIYGLASTSLVQQQSVWDGDQGLYSVTAPLAMVDRHGNLATDSGGNDVLYQQLAPLLLSYLHRAQAIPNGVVRAAGGMSVDYTEMNRGSILVLDVKGDDPDLPSGYQPNASNRFTSNASMYKTLLASINAVHQFESQYHVDLSQAIIYKIVLKRMKSVTNFQSDLAALQNPKPSWTLSQPQLVFINYPGDQNNTGFPNDPSQDNGWNATFEDYRSNYSGYIGMSLNYRNPEDGLGPTQAAERVAGNGVSTFTGMLSFPEGNRNSTGTCCAAGQPLHTWAVSTMEFISPTANYTESDSLGAVTSVPSIPGATSITADGPQNVIAFLKQIGRRNTCHITQSTDNPTCTGN